MLILYELLWWALSAVDSLRVPKAGGASSYTSVTVGGRWIH